MQPNHLSCDSTQSSPCWSTWSPSRKLISASSGHHLKPTTVCEGWEVDWDVNLELWLLPQLRLHRDIPPQRFPYSWWCSKQLDLLTLHRPITGEIWSWTWREKPNLLGGSLKKNDWWSAHWITGQTLARLSHSCPELSITQLNVYVAKLGGGAKYKKMTS